MRRRGLERIEALLPAFARERFVDGNARQPSRKARLRAELREVLVGADVSLLHHVFRLVVALQDGARDTEYTPIVPAHQDLEAARLASANACDHRFVAETQRFARARCKDAVFQGVYPN